MNHHEFVSVADLPPPNKQHISESAALFMPAIYAGNF